LEHTKNQTLHKQHSNFFHGTTQWPLVTYLNYTTTSFCCCDTSRSSRIPARILAYSFKTTDNVSWGLSDIYRKMHKLQVVFKQDVPEICATTTPVSLEQHSWLSNITHVIR
jgi:hypothetical protein